MSHRVLIAINTAWNLANFRAGLIRRLAAEGYEVLVVAPYDSYARTLPALGCRYLSLPMDNKGVNPLADLALLLRFILMFRRERPAVYLGYTIKPNIFGSIAAHAIGIPAVNNVAGLGATFINRSWLTCLVKWLYKLAFARSSKVFFQNKDDQALFVSSNLVRSEKTECLPGSGVDLARFSLTPPRNPDGRIRFLMMGRMLWDKGVGVFVEAAKIVKCSVPNADFLLLGFLDVKNPAAITREQMEQWCSDGVVRYLGESADVREAIAAADCVVLPSYREGTPRSLLEAAAMGRPVITTDAPGCRDVVEDGKSGFLCQVKDASSLADAMLRFIALDPLSRQTMGLQGREKMENEFNEQFVINRYLATLAQLMPASF